MKKPELLAPAGNLEKLKFAVLYGADAVYLGGKNFSLRAFAGNFEIDEIQEGVKFAHEHNVKVYVTINIFPHNADLIGLDSYLKDLYDVGVDAIICADPGVIMIAKETVPKLEIHLSTQANNVNWASAKFWLDQGINRIVAARELSLNEIKEIKDKTGAQMECFVHGAMCISYSGRCLLSNYMVGRDANLGECAQACRWNYNLVEEKRPGVYYPVFEDEKGTYVFNSQDLCLIDQLDKLIEAGIDSFKIEGRMKSISYVATILRSYRKAIDSFFEKNKYKVEDKWKEELDKISHRPYTTGFYFKDLNNASSSIESSNYIRPYEFLGVVLDYNENEKMVTIEQRNKFEIGDKIEFFGPTWDDFTQTIEIMYDDKGNQIQAAPHPNQIVKIPVKQKLAPYYIMRKEI
ncbi:peptidase U32 family protein [Desulfonispora thiosulfatigenes]|nr:U32 family peptidase [Desulfonispora thiosulfatigenes]